MYIGITISQLSIKNLNIGMTKYTINPTDNTIALITRSELTGNKQDKYTN